MYGGGVTGCNQQTPAPNTFTITFDSNGGSEVPAITKEEGAVVEAPSDPTKTGYTFVEWQKEDGTAYDWTAPLTASFTLKAKWNLVSYTITYLPDGVETDNPTAYTFETETFTLSDPTKGPDATKPNFVGWYEDEACTIAATEIEKGSTGAKTFYAKYTDKAVYTVKFILDGNDFGKVQKVEEGKTVTAIEGYDMYSDKDCTKAFDIKTEIKAETTIYLKAKEFTVTFNSDGGSAVAAAKVKYNETVQEPTAPTKEGFNFDGWYNGDTKFDFKTKITKDLTLKAKWKVETTPEPKWPNALPTGKGAPFIVNSDSTVSSTFTAAYNGNGIVVYINKDKSAVAAGSTVKVTFDYKTTTWKDETIKPKFKVALCTAAEDYWSYTNCTEGSKSYAEYWDAENLEGSITLSRKASADADMLAIQFNADGWPETGADTDSIDITLKSVEVIVPDPNVRKWDTPEITSTPAAMTDNGDGTVSAKVENLHGGTGFVVYINEDKSDIEVGKKVKVVFDYSVVEGEWKSEDAYPKFKLELLGKETADYWSASKASSTSYNNGDALKGTMTVNIDATAAANMLHIGLNPDNLTDDDKSVNITLKSVEVE